MATNNEHKLREIRQILDGRFEVLGLQDIGCHEDIPETSDTLEGNALQKARYVHDHYGMDCFADDTGLEVEVCLYDLVLAVSVVPADVTVFLDVVIERTAKG